MFLFKYVCEGHYLYCCCFGNAYLTALEVIYTVRTKSTCLCLNRTCDGDNYFQTQKSEVSSLSFSYSSMLLVNFYVYLSTTLDMLMSVRNISITLGLKVYHHHSIHHTWNFFFSFYFILFFEHFFSSSPHRRCV